MPRYFFHLHGSGARDTKGQEFPNDDAARQEAVLVARELSKNRTLSASARLVVTNTKGEIIHEEPLVHRYNYNPPAEPTQNQENRPMPKSLLDIKAWVADISHCIRDVRFGS